MKMITAGCMCLLTIPVMGLAKDDPLRPIDMPPCSKRDITNSDSPADIAIKQRTAFMSYLGISADNLTEARVPLPQLPKGFLGDSIGVRRGLEANNKAGKLVPQQDWSGESGMGWCAPPLRSNGELFCTIMVNDSASRIVTIAVMKSGDRRSCAAWISNYEANKKSLGLNDWYDKEANEFFVKMVRPETKFSDLSPSNPYRMWAEKNPCLWNTRLSLTPQCASVTTTVAVTRKTGSDPVGGWVASNVTLQITKAGDLVRVVARNPTGMLNGTYVGKYADGKIDLSMPMCGPLTYVRDGDKIYFCGNEFSRQ